MNVIDKIASKGRGGDTRVAHMTTGEGVVPKAVMRARPDVARKVADGIRSMGGDPGKYVVGRGNTNPQTGAEEFAFPDPTPAPVAGPAGTTVNTSQTGGSYLTGDPADLPTLTASQSTGVWDGSDLGSQFDKWKDSAGYAGDLASANSYLSTHAAGAAPAPAANTLTARDPSYFANLSGGSTEAQSPMSAAAATTAAGAATGDTSSTVSDWYRNVVGRDPDPAGLAYWTNQVNTLGAQAAYSSFLGSASSVDPSYTKSGMTLGQASTPYSGVQSTDSGSIVDDWARSVFGRDATPQEKAQFGNLANGGDAQAMYQQFVAQGKAAGGTARDMTWQQASQLGGPASTTTANGTPTISVNPTAMQPATHWNVGADETVAAQLEKLLMTDSPLMQLAATRAQQASEARGLSNSSMAATAGQAAMIDKALPIAQQDAGTYANAAQLNASADNTFSRDANQRTWDAAMANFNLSANNWLSTQNFQRDWAANEHTFSHDLQLRQLDAGSQANTLQRGYVNAINQARTDYSNALGSISSNKDMSAELKTQTLDNLRTSYNTVIENYAKLLGWDPTSWLISTSTSGSTGAGASGGTAAGQMSYAGN